MARSKAFDVDETLQKALEEFRRRSYSGASIADLLGAMKLNRASMYSTYGNKEDLFAQVLEFYTTQQKQDIQSLVERGLTPRKRLETLLRNCYKESDGSPRLAGCLVLTSLAEYSTFTERIQLQIHDYLHFVQQIINEWVELELIKIGRRIEDADVLSAQILNSWVTLQMLGRGGMELTMLDKLANAAVQGLDVSTGAPKLYLHLQTAVDQAALALENDEVQQAAYIASLPWFRKITHQLAAIISINQLEEIGFFKFLLSREEEE